jgi:hypothetical protein
MVSRLYELWDVSKQRSLTDLEFREAFDLITRPVYSKDYCPKCPPKKKIQAIYDVPFCQEHIHSAILKSRK